MTAPSRYPAGYVREGLASEIVKRCAELGRDCTHANAQIAVATLIDLGWIPPQGETVSNSIHLAPAVICTHRPIMAPAGTPEDVLERIRQILAPFEAALPEYLA